MVHLQNIVITSSFYALGTRFQNDVRVRANHESYASLHNYTYDTECDAVPVPWPYELISPNYWAKVYKVWNCLNTYPEADAVFWIDGDAIFTKPEVHLGTFFPSTGTACVIANAEPNTINAGAVLFLNNGCSRTVLSFLHANRGRFRRSYLPEQDAMILYRKQRRRQDIFLYEPGELQSLVKRAEFEEGKSFIAHFTFVNNKTLKESIMSYAMNQMKRFQATL